MANREKCCCEFAQKIQKRPAGGSQNTYRFDAQGLAKSMISGCPGAPKIDAPGTQK